MSEKNCRAQLGYYLVHSCNQPAEHRCEECGNAFCRAHLTGLRCSRCSLTNTKLDPTGALTSEDLEWLDDLAKVLAENAAS